MYLIIVTATFNKQFKKLAKKTPQLEQKILRQLYLLHQNPKHPSLRSHQVGTRYLGKRWSSWVTGDIRIIWDYSQEQKLTIEALDIGSHSGKHKAYN